MKTVVASFLSLIIFVAAKAQSFDSTKITWYDFYWDGSEEIPKEAIMLRSKIDTVNFNFRWQFDTGSPRTFFYGNAWKSFGKAFPYLNELFFVTDSSKSDGYINVRNTGIRISGKKLPKNIVGIMPGYGDEIDTDIILANMGASVTIGTIGIDLFRNGVLLIDFKNIKLGYADILPDSFYNKKRNTVDFTLYQNRIIIPVNIDGKNYPFFYDSGASLFPLKTTAPFTQQLPGIRYTDTLYNITTWGKSYDVPGGPFKGKVKIGSMSISQPKAYVHPDPDKYHTDIFKEAKTYGLIGNDFFYNKIIVIDFTRMKFTIVE